MEGLRRRVIRLVCILRNSPWTLHGKWVAGGKSESREASQDVIALL